MGRDKATLAIGGVPLALAAAKTLAAVVAEVVLADRGRGVIPGFPSVPDGPGSGPAAGILGAAAARPGAALLVLACDLPAVPSALLRALGELAAATSADLVLPRWPGGLEPLCALYRPRAIAELASRVAVGELALHPLAAAPGLAVSFLEGTALAALGEPARMFRNLNRPEDLDARDPAPRTRGRSSD